MTHIWKTIEDARRGVESLRETLAALPPVIEEPPITMVDAERELVARLDELQRNGCDRAEALRRLSADPRMKTMQRIALGLPIEVQPEPVSAMAEAAAEARMVTRLAELERDCGNDRTELLRRVGADAELRDLQRLVLGLGGAR